VDLADARAALRAEGGVTGLDSVYVHAPFCARRCFYCDFAVKVRRTGDAPTWAAALAAEIRILAEAGVAPAPRLATLYVGGGTPSLLGPEAMRLLREVLGEDRLADPSLEWTSEANPESLTPEVARGWHEAGVNRLSLGVQSFQEGVLRWMGRLHGAEGARRAVDTAREAGVENVSVDLIFGLPESLERDWSRDLEEAVALGVPHVSLYGLTAEAGTPLGRRVHEGRVSMPSDDRYREEYLQAHRTLRQAGYRHYEVSNFALPGLESRHNLRYWDDSPYLGLGNSSHSYLPPVRRWNLREWDAYLQAVGEGRSPVSEEETVEGSSSALERIWLGLRTDAGIPASWLESGAGAALAASWEDHGLARVEGGRLVLTAEGWLLLDRLAVELSDAGVGPPPDA